MGKSKMEQCKERSIDGDGRKTEYKIFCHTSPDQNFTFKHSNTFNAMHMRHTRML